MSLVNQVSDRVMALNYGKVIAMGTPGKCSPIRRWSRPTWVGRPRHERSAAAGELYRNVLWAYSSDPRRAAGCGSGPDRYCPGRERRWKTSILRTISGHFGPGTRSDRFEGHDIARRPPDQVMRLGICHVPEGREIFPFLTVRENLNMGAYTRRDTAGACERHRALLRLLPPAEGTGIATRGSALRRRAADAGNQPSPDGAAKVVVA